MCRQLNISRAAYYKWLHRSVPEQEAENIKLAELIKEYDERFGHILGLPISTITEPSAGGSVPGGLQQGYSNRTLVQ